MLDMDRAREVFEASEDFTVGIEEEFADPRSRDARPRASASRSCATPRRRRPGAGRLGRRRADLVRDRDPLRARATTFADAVARQREARARLFRLAARARRAAGGDRHPPVEPVAGAAHHRHRALPPRARSGSSTSPGATTRSRCTCTSASAGADRAIAVCDRLRALLPDLLAISANSPFLDGRDSGLHSARTQIFTQELPALRHPRAVRRLGRLRRLRRLPRRRRTRSSSTRSSGGASGRTTTSARSRCGSATPRRAPRTRPRWRA